MEQKKTQTFKIDKKHHKDILDFTKLNGIQDVDVFINNCFKKGFDIERFGSLNNSQNERIIEKIVEIPVEIIKYIDREVILETKESNTEEKVKKLETTLLNLKKELILKEKKIKQLEDMIKSGSETQMNPTYLKGSNLKEKL